MRKALAIATLVVAGAGAIGAGAALNFNGSDTLGDFTAELLTAQNIAQTQNITGAPFCHLLNGSVYVDDAGVTDPWAAALNGNLVYLGGGSGTGENQMVAGNQGLAPMSKFLTSTSCVGTLTYNSVSTTAAATQAGGLVVALDGLSILSSTATGGTTACNGNPSDTLCSGEATEGLAYNTTFTYPLASGGTGTYTFQVWQDVLKLLYFGIVNASGVAQGLTNSCASPARIALANNWGALFENPSCDGTGALGVPACKQLQHVFRRDDASGTSDIFSSLLGASGPNTTANVVNTEIGTLTLDGGSAAHQYGMGSDSFCNDFQNQPTQFKQVWPGNNPPNLLLGVAFTQFTNGNGVVGSQTAGQNVGVVPNDHQDYDPIRRPCEGNGPSVGTATVPNPTEQVCNRGTLDLANTTVIPVADGGVTYNCGANDAGVCPGNEICYAPNNTGTQTSSQQGFPSGQCWGGKDLAASQVALGTKASCAAGGGSGSCPFSESCLLDDGSVPAAGTAGSCWEKPAQGSLGLVLPMVDSTILATQVDTNNNSLNIQYDVTTAPNPTPGQVNLCTSTTTVKPAFVYRYSPTGVPSRNGALCPNGDISQPAGSLCYVPADSDGNPNCLSLAGTTPPQQTQCGVGGTNPGPNGGGQGTVDGTSCSGYGPDPGRVDPRAYNLYVWRNTGSCLSNNSTTGACNSWSGQWIMATDDSSVAPGANTRRPLFGGAYFKIHTSQDMMVPNAASYNASGVTSTLCHQGGPTSTQVGCPTLCTQADMTDQIGCVVQASPCSIGFAGRHAADQSLAINVGGTTGTTSGTALVAVSERVLGVPATVQCVQNFAAAGAGVSYYPISRKLYLNSTIGFQNVTTAEQALAGCENTSALVNQAVAENFFVPLPPTLPDGGPSVNGGLPFCEDFNEEMLCAPSKGYPYAGDTAAGGNVNACPTFASTFNIGNGTQTTCGNGIVEQFEDCDFGTQGIGADGGVIYQADGGLVNGATVDSTGKAVPPGTGCSSICRKQ